MSKSRRHDQVGGSPAIRLRLIRTCMILMLVVSTSIMEGILGAPGKCVGMSAPKLLCSLRIRGTCQTQPIEKILRGRFETGDPNLAMLTWRYNAANHRKIGATRGLWHSPLTSVA